MKKMNPKWKGKWIEALRSDKYKQGRRKLYNSLDDTYCCLGVLPRVMGLHPRDCELVVLALLNHKTARAAGLPCVKGDQEWDQISDRNVQKRLANMNDNGYSFAEIADWIEKHL